MIPTSPTDPIMLNIGIIIRIEDNDALKKYPNITRKIDEKMPYFLSFKWISLLYDIYSHFILSQNSSQFLF